jgi:hypothetical protein
MQVTHTEPPLVARPQDVGGPNWHVIIVSFARKGAQNEWSTLTVSSKVLPPRPGGGHRPRRCCMCTHISGHIMTTTHNDTHAESVGHAESGATAGGILVHGPGGHRALLPWALPAWSDAPSCGASLLHTTARALGPSLGYLSWGVLPKVVALAAQPGSLLTSTRGKPGSQALCSLPKSYLGTVLSAQSGSLLTLHGAGLTAKPGMPDPMRRAVCARLSGCGNGSSAWGTT